jgi:predicted alpha/beta superfamily hydrolase
MNALVFVVGTTINLDDLNENTLEENTIGDILYLVNPDIGNAPPSFNDAIIPHSPPFTFEESSVTDEIPSMVEVAPKVPISVKEGSEEPKKKKRKVTTQDIQEAQLNVLMLERQKITVEIQNMQLLQAKLKLQVAEIKAKANVD